MLKCKIIEFRNASIVCEDVEAIMVEGGENAQRFELALSPENMKLLKRLFDGIVDYRRIIDLNPKTGLFSISMQIVADNITAINQPVDSTR